MVNASNGFPSLKIEKGFDGGEKNLVKRIFCVRFPKIKN